MAITVAQLPAALVTISSLQNTLNNLGTLLNQAKNLSDKGWFIDIGSTGPILVPVPGASQASLIIQYDALKAQLVTTFNQLP